MSNPRAKEAASENPNQTTETRSWVSIVVSKSPAGVKSKPIILPSTSQEVVNGDESFSTADDLLFATTPKKPNLFQSRPSKSKQSIESDYVLINAATIPSSPKSKV